MVSLLPQTHSSEITTDESISVCALFGSFPTIFLSQIFLAIFFYFFRINNLKFQEDRDHILKWHMIACSVHIRFLTDAS